MAKNKYGIEILTNNINPDAESEAKFYKKIVLFSIIALIVIAIIITSLWFILNNNPTKDISKSKPTTGNKIIIHEELPKPAKTSYYAIKDPLIITFPKTDKYSLMEIHIVYWVRKRRDIGHIQLFQPMLIHKYIEIIEKYKGETLITAAGRTKLKNEFQHTTNYILNKYSKVPDKSPVVDIFFADFLIQ